MKALVQIILLVSLVQASTAQEVLVQPEDRFGTRLVLVVDCSSSMTNSAEEAISWLNTIVQQPVDELEIAVYFFGAYCVRYPEEENTYIELPNPEEVEKISGTARAYINRRKDRNDTTDWFPLNMSTRIRAPIVAAIAEPDVDIIVISDCLFDDVSDDDWGDILEGFEGMVGVIVTDLRFSNTTHMEWFLEQSGEASVALARAGRGGLYRSLRESGSENEQDE